MLTEGEGGERGGGGRGEGWEGGGRGEGGERGSGEGGEREEEEELLSVWKFVSSSSLCCQNWG